MVAKTAALALALLLDPASALLGPQCCVSRVSMSRVVPASAARLGLPCMCEEPAAPAEEAAPVEAAAEEPAKRGRSRAPKTPLEDLEQGVEMQGTVRSVMNYGAFVDIGAATDGLLHVSEISNEFVKDATEQLSVGDTVTVRIKSINFEKKQMALTAKDENAAPAARAPRVQVDYSEFLSADEKVFVTGTVSRVQDYGAFIALKEGIDGLVHISEIQDGGVSSVEDVLSPGQEVQVRIINCDPSKRRIGLSMRPWVAEEDRPKRKPREDRGGGDVDDKQFHLSSEELEALSTGDDVEVSVFDSAFIRMESAAQAKKEGKKFVRTL